MRPGDGVNVSGCSALMRHSIAWPRIDTGLRMISLQLLARRDADLALHQIDAGDRFGDRMLHLNARVHFDEVEIAVRDPSETRPCRRWCSRSLCSATRRVLGHAFSRSSGAHRRRGRFLDQLLMPALDGAFALAQNLDVAVLVGQHLKFDVPRMLDQLLHVHVAAGKRRAGFLLRLRQQMPAIPRRLRTTRMPRPPPPAEAFSITG